MSLLERISVVVIDDHAVVREGLKMLFNAQPDLMVVGEAADGESAVKLVTDVSPEIVMLDLSLRGLHGVATTIRLREACPDCKILAFTVHEETDMVKEMMEVGASGYVLKRSPPEELLTAVRTVARGGVYVDRAVAGQITRGAPRTAGGDVNAPSPLSNRETEVLRLLAAGHTNKDIAESLCVSVKTVETYKARVMAKLNLHRRVDIVKYACRRGWLVDL